MGLFLIVAFQSLALTSVFQSRRHGWS